MTRARAVSIQPARSRQVGTRLIEAWQVTGDELHASD